ncbi:YTH domain [Melia azedarach]|uniref:YTH domain n=1 Tax=Melia azedarach TaxID=155640 RepID=A0ACC1X3J9_MELAZ|nr:YTH domain [Melia azedarach]
MATAPHFSLPHKPLEEMMKNLKVVDSSAHLSSSNKVPSKEESPSDATSCISSAGDAIGSLKESDMDHESLATDQGATYQAGAYYGYCYPGYDAAFWELDDQGYYVAGDGMELQYPVIQADNGSFMYVIPAFQPGYSSYGPYLPVATFGVDGQYLGQQPFSPGPLFQPSIASPGYYPNALPYGELVPSPYPCDPSFLVGDATYGNNFNGLHEIPCSKSNVSSASHNHAPVSKKLPNSDFGHPPELKKSLPSLNVSTGHDMHQLKPRNKPDAPGRGYFPFAKFPLYNQGKVGGLYSNSAVNYKPNVRGWGGSEKTKTRSRVNSISDFGLLAEQKYVPRTTNTKDALISGVNTVGPLATDENGNSDSITSPFRKEQYNLPDFPTQYDQALFFVIKSYSEDDIHKSIKYKVWASTPNGNKRLDTAYEDAQNRKAEKGSKCPLFLFFSVNASGQFCGVAEMIGHVDFNKNMDFWQQDKWNGYFPVQWHIVKDVPNPQLRHIILENNDNKPITNSRDTQEVRFSQGIEMLNIFKNYPAKTSILDDFDFYESRQKVMQEKKIRPSIPHPDHIQQKADELTFNFQSVDLSAAENAGEPCKE